MRILAFKSRSRMRTMDPFLDISVSKSANGFSTSLVRKNTFTCLYSDYSSLTPKWHNLISILVFCAFECCSSYKNFHCEIFKIKNILHMNCSSKSLVDSIIPSFLNKQFNFQVKAPREVDNKHTILFSLPFLEPHRIRIRNNVSKFLKKHCSDVRLVTVFGSP